MGMNVKGLCSSDVLHPGTQLSVRIMSMERRLIMFMLKTAEEYFKLTFRLGHAH